ncbi:hypothetical protein MRB53_040686 [Persea americana]|nr:hypothetical protein MRB53_040686 [Persea americana]
MESCVCKVAVNMDEASMATYCAEHSQSIPAKLFRRPVKGVRACRDSRTKCSASTVAGSSTKPRRVRGTRSGNRANWVS